MPHVQPTLDEITNKVFEELLVGKSRSKYQYSEGSCKVRKMIFKMRKYLYNFLSYFNIISVLNCAQSDDQRSEGSSILSSKFFLRDSTIHGKKKVIQTACRLK